MNVSTLSISQDSEIFVNATETQNHKFISEHVWIFLTLDATSLLANCYFHWLTHRMIQREKLKKGYVLMQYLLLPYAILTPIVCLLSIIYADILLTVDSPPSHYISKYFCYGHEIFAHVSGLYVGSFSLFAAVLKYWFIVNSTTAKRYGEERLSRKFMIFYLIIPIIVAMLNSLSNGNKDILPWVNYCWGNTRDSKNTETNEYELLNCFSCENNQYVTENLLGIESTHFIISVLRTICSGIKTLYVLLFSNIPEMFFYWRIFIHVNRYI
jgi:hypothetical protein